MSGYQFSVADIAFGWMCQYNCESMASVARWLAVDCGTWRRALGKQRRLHVSSRTAFRWRLAIWTWYPSVSTVPENIRFMRICRRPTPLSTLISPTILSKVSHSLLDTVVFCFSSLSRPTLCREVFGVAVVLFWHPDSNFFDGGPRGALSE